MIKSLYTKLVIVMLVLILSLLSVVGAFLMNEIRGFYLEDFYEKMKTVFESRDLSVTLYAAADSDDAPTNLAAIIRTYAGELGIDSRSRNYYILDGDTGAVLAGSGSEAQLPATPNIVSAIAGEEGYLSDRNASYMDVALPISGSAGSYIIYINDNKSTVYGLSDTLFGIIAQSMLVGLAISVVLSLLMAKAIVTPIQKLTVASSQVASGDFSQKPESLANDEIGVLTRTFNEMADRLEDTLDSLTRSEAMRKEFVANVSHELRTPITNIRSYAETLQDNIDLLPEDTRQNFLNVIVNESDRMTKIVQDLLTLSRFDAGSFEFNFERFSLKQSIDNMYSAMQLEAQKHGHIFTLEYMSEMPEIVGDKARIEQVLINMVSNALKYTKDGGVVSITAGSDEDTVWVTVKDNGIGIPEEDVPKVFDRFYRVDKARSRESGGTGLGLSIAQEIIQRHQGDIGLSSQLGEGTAITIVLPVEGPKND